MANAPHWYKNDPERFVRMVGFHMGMMVACEEFLRLAYLTTPTCSGALVEKGEPYRSGCSLLTEKALALSYETKRAKQKKRQSVQAQSMIFCDVSVRIAEKGETAYSRPVVFGELGRGARLLGVANEGVDGSFYGCPQSG